LFDNKGDGKIILIMGIAVLLTGIGVGIYIGMFSISTYSNTIPANTVPTWFAFLIAVVFAILGIVLIVLGARELGFHYFDNDAKT
jgi:protein-S-isoprenylcysteine O-methyltransferase Ste14